MNTTIYLFSLLVIQLKKFNSIKLKEIIKNSNRIINPPLTVVLVLGSIEEVVSSGVVVELELVIVVVVVVELGS
jgi:hypothetical protein